MEGSGSATTYDFTFFSQKCRHNFIYILYFFSNSSLLHGHENLRILIFEIIDFDPEKIERKGGARFLAFSIYTFILTCEWSSKRHISNRAYFKETLQF